MKYLVPYGFNAGTVIEDTWCMKYLVPYGTPCNTHHLHTPISYTYTILSLCVAVSFVVSSVPIDLSSYTDIAKNVFPYLSSPCQNTREEAQGLMEALAKQCSDKAAAQELQLRFSDALKCTLHPPFQYPVAKL